MRKISCLCLVFTLCLCLCSCESSDYKNAMLLYDAGEYPEAIAAFEALGDYKDSVPKIADCETAILDEKYNDAVSLMLAEQYEDAITAFAALDGYRDSVTMIENCNTAIMDAKYNDAIAGMELNPVQAFEALIALKGYKDSAQKADSLYENYTAEKRKAANVGDYIPFGAYEQDNNHANGKEYIEWLVLDRKENKILVISKYGLDCQWYNEQILKPVTWQTCSLRKWLNDSFLNTAFSSTEQSMISRKRQDSVFLLSIDEAYKYFNEENSRACKPTDYAVSIGAHVDSDSGICYWWVRRDEYTNEPVGIFKDNSIIIWEVDKMHTFYRNVCIRPAMWLSTES